MLARGPSPEQRALAPRRDPPVCWRGSARTLPAGAGGPVTRSTTPRVTRVPVVIPTARWWWQALHRPAWQPACSHGDRGHSMAYRHPRRGEGDWEALRVPRMGRDPVVLGLTPGVATDWGWVLDLRTGMEPRHPPGVVETGDYGGPDGMRNTLGLGCTPKPPGVWQHLLRHRAEEGPREVRMDVRGDSHSGSSGEGRAGPGGCRVTPPSLTCPEQRVLGGTGGLCQQCPCAGAHPKRGPHTSERSETLSRFTQPSSVHLHHGAEPPHGRVPTPQVCPSIRGRLLPPRGPFSERVTRLTRRGSRTGSPAPHRGTSASQSDPCPTQGVPPHTTEGAPAPHRGPRPTSNRPRPRGPAGRAQRPLLAAMSNKPRPTPPGRH